MNINSLTPLILLTFITVLPVQANDSQLVAQGKKCATFIDNRLERLRCFDEAFDTQLPSSQSIQITNIEESKPDQRPAFWHRVVKQEGRRKSTDNFISNLVLNEGVVSGDLSQQIKADETEKLQDVIISQTALGTLPPRSILVISCIDNITRLQLLLHQAIDEGMTPLALEVDGQAIASRWFSESNGYLIRAGRGLPGIQDIRSMFDKKTLVIRSKVPEIDGLSFELKELKEAIKPLRNACHW